MKKRLIVVLYALLGMILWGCANRIQTPYLTTQQVIDGLQLQPMSEEASLGYFLSTYESQIKADIPKISANIRKIQMPCVTAVGVGTRRPVHPYVLYRGPGPGCILYDSIPLIR